MSEPTKQGVEPRVEPEPLAGRRVEPRVLRVPTESRSGANYYEVCLGRGLLSELGGLILSRCPAHGYGVITDSQVVTRYGAVVLESLRTAGGEVQLFQFPAGEWNKTREVWARASDEMLRAGFGRDGAVVALGGGVVGDLGGFVAATFLRGIPVVQVPTTLVAMLDSSIGGKTGVDTPAGKNLVGAFHPPALVVIDPETLGTLPAHQLAAGLAEAFKHGAIADAEYFERVAGSVGAFFAHDMDALEWMILRSLEIKAEVVAADEREAGYRKVLNFGHTVAHALEAITGYELLHGEAVAIGMVAEVRLGERVGVTRAGDAERLSRALEGARLPTELPADVSADAFFRAVALDKKRAGGVVEYTLLEEIGRVARSGDAWTRPVPEAVAREVLFGG
ncbi:MAG: 3-dehydroquinate synthase [Gemmatimonadetes bacterium]|nr:3-dehydroquinate synthase [Gemmatimonadota bacterium]